MWYANTVAYCYILARPSEEGFTDFWEPTRDFHGTEGEKAVIAKIQALEQEFDHFRDTTSEIKWCREAWWDESRLTLKDWQTADSWFRSRVLELPTLGPGMAPVLDFANHSLQANACYSVCGNSDLLLLLQDEGKGGTLENGREITIKYVMRQGVVSFRLAWE